jgi:hypothetical protein
MRIAIGCLVALWCVWSASPAAAAHMPPSTIVTVCKFDSDHDRANCDAFLRGSLERFEANATKANSNCRTKPFGADDITSFLRYSAAHMIPDSGEAFALAFNYWGSNPQNIPCNSVPGYWTTRHLVELCTADISGGSPCKFYTASLVMVAQVEEVVTKTHYFCPKGEAVRPDEEVLENLKSWVAADPARGNEPAAIGYIDALKAAYPC